MPSYQAINKSNFGHLKWKRYENYQFASLDTVAPIVVQELSKVCLSLPIVFIKQENEFVSAVLQGLQQGQNLCVAPDGRYIIPYVPSVYRSYPFNLAQADHDQLVLCADMDSGLIGEYFEESFFDNDGNPSKPVREVLHFLQQVSYNKQLTRRVCAALDVEELIEPWPIKIKNNNGDEQTINGLYRINESKFNSLNADALFRIHQAGAMPVVYCQLLSMQHIHTLGKLAEAHSKLQPQDVDIEELFGEPDDTLKFNF